MKIFVSSFETENLKRREIMWKVWPEVGELRREDNICAFFNFLFVCKMSLRKVLLVFLALFLLADMEKCEAGEEGKKDGKKVGKYSSNFKKRMGHAKAPTTTKAGANAFHWHWSESPSVQKQLFFSFFLSLFLYFFLSSLSNHFESLITLQYAPIQICLPISFSHEIILAEIWTIVSSALMKPSKNFLLKTSL